MRLFFLLFALILGIPVHSAQINSLDLISNSKKVISLESPKKKVIYFLSSKCPCSQAHFTHLNNLRKEFKNFEFLAFHSNKLVDSHEAKKYFDQFKINFPVFLDKDLIFANQYKALKTPHVYVLDENNRVIYQGGATNSRNPNKASKFYLQEVLTALEQNKEIPYHVQKTLGCYIQR